MLFLTVLLPYLLSSLQPVAGLSFFGGNQVVLNEEKTQVPGENPLYFCEASSDYTLTIDKVDLDPNPPKAGETLTIEAKGTFTEEVEEGAYISLVIKYGLITLIKTTADLCEQMKEVDEDCPLNGTKTITKEVNIPSQVPPGKYNVLANVFTKDDKQITCLTASVEFGL